MKIFLARHGKTNYNTVCKLSGRTNLAQLTQEGKLQAKKMGEALAKESITKIFCSSLDRAVETTKIISEKVSGTIEKEPLLMEFDFGKLDCLEDDKEEARKYLIGRRMDLSLKFPGGESYSDVLNRIQIFLEKINLNSSEDILIVSHAATTRALLVTLLEMNEEETNKIDTIDCLNGLIYCVDTEKKEASWINANSMEKGRGLLYRTSY